MARPGEPKIPDNLRVSRFFEWQNLEKYQIFNLVLKKAFTFLVDFEL